MAKTSKRSTRGFSNDVMDLAQGRPIAAAAAAAAAVGAGVFLWSRRNQISNQISDLSDQISEWTENMRSGSSSGDWSEREDTAGTATLGQVGKRSTDRTSSSERGMSETGGGNASLGKQSGGGRTTGSGSGRRRVRPAPTT